MTKDNQTTAVIPANQQHVSAFSNAETFDTGQRMAKALAASDLVPQQYQGNIPNCLVAIEMAQRVGASPLMVAQNLNIIHGRPSWSSTYIIAALNACGRFAPIRFKVSGSGDETTCIAWTVDKVGEVLEGPPVSIGMAKAEGWFGKNGSKWKTMPELMLRYRAAAFFGRLYAPDVLMGMHTVEEIQDSSAEIDITPKTTTAGIDKLNEGIAKAKDSRKSAKSPIVIDAEANPPVVEQEIVQPLHTGNNDAVSADGIDDGNIF